MTRELERDGPARARLVVGLGNTLAGDDGIGAHVAEALRGDARLPDDVEVVAGGTDLLRLAALMRGRSDVLLIDAALGDAPGATRVVRDCRDEPGRAATRRSPHAHTLSAFGALELLRSSERGIRDTRFSWLLVEVAPVAAGESVSAALEPQLPELTTRALAALTALSAG